jgi:SNF2 family DNA or RNA helicase
MEIIENKALLLKLRNPAKVTDVIPKSKAIDAHTVLVNWGLDEAQVLKNLRIKNVPSPILRNYDWPGLHKPFDHQKTTSAFLTLHKKAFCLNEQGTGKTGSVIWAADYLLKQRRIRRVLVICPLSIMDSAWRSDLFKFAMHRSVDIAYGAVEKRRGVVNGMAEFVIINYDGVAVVEQEIAKGGFDLIVVDEANHYKNVSTERWKTLNRIMTPQTWLC